MAQPYGLQLVLLRPRAMPGAENSQPFGLKNQFTVPTSASWLQHHCSILPIGSQYRDSTT